MFFRQYAKKYTAFRTLECMYFCIQSFLGNAVLERQFLKKQRTG